MLRLSALIVVAAAVAVTGCANSASTTTTASSAPPSAYQQDITALTRYCTQDPAQLDAMVAKVHQLEIQDGIDDETMTQLAGHLLTAVSVYESRVSCIDTFAAYLTLRQGQ